MFFCGAGVSRARANLPDFWQLAERVVNELGVGPDEEARRLDVPRVRAYHYARNMGKGFALRYGVARSRGEEKTELEFSADPLYIFIMDA